MLKKGIFVLLLVLLAITSAMANGKADSADSGKPTEISFFWAVYSSAQDEIVQEVEDNFNAAHSDIVVDIIPVAWDSLLDKITTSVAANDPPALSVVGTRWILELMAMDALTDVTPYVSPATLDNIPSGMYDAKFGNEIYGLPSMAGARFLAINKNLTSVVPQTMEEMLAEAKRVAAGGDNYGLIMVGKKHTELTDFVYYFYSAGGEFFARKPDGSFGACTVNSPEGVKALSFMKEVVDSGVVQNGYLSLDRYQSHPLFYNGQTAYVMIGAFVEPELEKAGNLFDVEYALIPPFAGNDPKPLTNADSIVMFEGVSEEQKKAAGVFLDYMFSDEVMVPYSVTAGFPAVTKTAGRNEAFNKPVYKAMAESAVHAQSFPLVEGWGEYSDIIWDAVQEVFLDRMTPQEALDKAAQKIDSLRGM